MPAVLVIGPNVMQNSPFLPTQTKIIEKIKCYELKMKNKMTKIQYK